MYTSRKRRKASSIKLASFFWYDPCIRVPKFSLKSLLNELGLGTSIDPAMALTPLPTKIRLDEVQPHAL